MAQPYRDMSGQVSLNPQALAFAVVVAFAVLLTLKS
jgi:hypothetical protein